jgi:hypothetical protein
MPKSPMYYNIQESGQMNHILPKMKKKVRKKKKKTLYHHHHIQHYLQNPHKGTSMIHMEQRKLQLNNGTKSCCIYIYAATTVMCIGLWISGV